VLILLIEDEPRVAGFIQKGLEACGYQTDIAATAAEGVDLALSERPYELILLDIGLPDRDGFEVLAELRTVDQTTPVIVLTARGDVPSRVRGLDLGADDYLPKPFDFDELLARIRARLRDVRQPTAHTVTAGGLTLDLRSRRVQLDDRSVDLTSREFGLLEFLMRHQGQVLSRVQILSSVWGYDFDPGTNVVDVYVGYLRSKLGDAEGTLIETVRGGGYRFQGVAGPD
jgi:DNA-binding response OmpR family regulator